MTQVDLVKKLIDSSETIVYIKDEQGRFLMVSRQVSELLETSIEEIIGKTDYDFYSRENADMFRKHDRQVTDAGTPMSFKVTVTFADGQHTFVDRKFPVSDIEGSPNAVGGIAIDITTMD